MAYADYKFYTESFGNVVPETDFHDWQKEPVILWIQ